MLRKITKPVASLPGVTTPPAHVSFEKHPTVWEFLASVRWQEDDTPRVPGTILMMVDAAGLKVCLNDRDQERAAFSVLGPEDELMDHLEALLTASTTDWRPQKKYDPKANRK